MDKTISTGQIELLIESLFSKPLLNEYSNIISLTNNEIADLSLKISKLLKSNNNLDELLTSVLKALGESGIAERVLLFQMNSSSNKASLINSWSSQYINEVNSIGFEIDFSESTIFKFLSSDETSSIQIEDISKFLGLPNYILKNKLKAFVLKLKAKSLLIISGITDSSKIILNLQFSTRNVVWSNEIEKLLQSVVDQLVTAIQGYSQKQYREKLQKNIIELKESTLQEQEEMLRKFASDLHDLPCSIIPSLKNAIDNKDLHECKRLVDELHINLRQLINEYVIPDLNLLGFNTALFQFVNGFKKSFKGKVNIELSEEDLDLSYRKGTELFKVIKEWFCNIEKHSEANEVTFKLKKLNDCYIAISIHDNGKGFDIKNLKNYGYGLINIQKRLKEINSRFEIKSEINKGSLLKIQVCLSQ